MSAKHKRAAWGLAAFACALTLFWWAAWRFHALHGWTAFPIGFTGGAIIYALGSICIFAAVDVADDKQEHQP